MINRVVIIQSNYIPWKGYFDLLAHADTVVFFDNVQSTKNDWRNRNVIKTNAGKTWLTIPIRHSNSLRIREVEVASSGWHLKHIRTLQQAYARAPSAEELMPEIANWYHEAGQLAHLSMINQFFLRKVAKRLAIGSRFVEVGSILSDDEHDALEPTTRLVEVCKRVGATSYLSGPAARNYLVTAAFEKAGIAVEWFNYNGYPPYPQLHGEFDHAVSALDLLLMTGSSARRYAIRTHTDSF